MIECRTLEGFRTSRDGLRRAKLACAHADGPLLASGLRFRSSSTSAHSGPAKRAAQPRAGVAGWSVASRPSLPAARLVGRLLSDNAIGAWLVRGENLQHRLKSADTRGNRLSIHT